MYKDITKLIIQTGDKNKIAQLGKVLFIVMSAILISQQYAEKGSEPLKEIGIQKKDVQAAIKIYEKYCKDNPEPTYKPGGIITKESSEFIINKPKKSI